MRSFSSKIIRTFSVATSLVGLVALNELSGYNAFDLTGSFNLACHIDPTCRKLTDEEIELARQYFGDDIDYDRVNYFTRPTRWGFGPTSRTTSEGTFNIAASVAHGNIYEVSENYRDTENTRYKNSVFIHEMAHVWQYQNGFLTPHYLRKEGHDDIYAVDIDAYDTFAEFGVEQQAEIIQTIFDLHARRDNGRDLGELSCETLNKYIDIASQVIPLDIQHCERPEDTLVPEI